jgi:lactoylglutathione lyase
VSSHVQAFSHFGLCVTDLDQSLAFYCQGLGFEPTMSHDVGDDYARLMELDHVTLQSRFVALGATSIELLHFVEPPAGGEPERRPVNKLGLTHLSLRVDDLDAVAADIARFGGTVLDDTRTTIDFHGAQLDFVYCTDPNGVRIELMQLPG